MAQHDADEPQRGYVRPIVQPWPEVITLQDKPAVAANQGPDQHFPADRFVFRHGPRHVLFTGPKVS
jgi:hypothetical protein